MPIDTIGDATAHSASWQNDGRVWQIVASGAGNLSSIGINVSAVGAGSNVRLALYTDVGGAAGTLLAQSSDTVAVTGWNDLPVTGVAVTGGTAYWIGFQASNNQLDVFKTTSATAVLYDVSQAYGVFPASPTWNQFTGQTIANLRMTYLVLIGQQSSMAVPIITVQNW